MRRTAKSNAPSGAVTPIPAKVEAAAEQSRFHAAAIETEGSEIDLRNVDLTVGGQELLVGARVLLEDGVKYGLIGRNGSGKSTLLNALAERLIPGIPRNIRITVVSQLENGQGDQHHPEDQRSPATADKARSALQFVLDGHVERSRLLREKALLEKALDGPDARASAEIYFELLLDHTRLQLEDAQLTALRRSGARGRDARAEEIEAEKRVKELGEQYAPYTERTWSREAELRVKASRGGAYADTWATDAAAMLAEVELDLDVLDSAEMDKKANEILLRLGFSQAMIDGPTSDLSGGWKSRCRLAIALIVPSDVLLLDEPSNFLDLEAIIWLQHHLKSLPQTVIITSHDQALLDAVAEETIALRHKGLKYFPGPPSEMHEAEEKERLGKVKQQAALDKKKEHIEASIAEGVRSAKKTGDDNRLKMAKSRTKKLNERWGAETSAKGTRFKLNRDLAGFHASNRDAIEIEAPEAETKIKLPPAAELRVAGDLVHLESVSLGYKKGEAIVEGVNLTIGYGDRVALVGKNGKGKSTIVKAIRGYLIPQKGKLSTHPGVKIGYFDQDSVQALDTLRALTPVQAFVQHFEKSDISTPTELQARASLAKMGLTGKTPSHTLIGGLSGGQKVRLALALLFHDPPNFLILDEVTTHLDASMILALAEALQAWKGGLLVVTHDRFFCNTVMAPPADTAGEDSLGRGLSATSRVYLVRKAGLKRLKDGMGEYETMLRSRLRRQGLVDA